MKLSIVIVSYNSSRFLPSCLDALLIADTAIDREIILVDNGSSDESVTLVKSAYPSVRVIENNANLGFAGGNNVGVRSARGEFLLFLNPDTRVQQGALSGMLRFLEENEETGAVGPKLLYPDESLQLSCREFYTIRSIIIRRAPFLRNMFYAHKLYSKHLMADWDHNSVRKVDWVLAAALMMRRSVFMNCGCFDEKYTLYFEDVDLCYRLSRLGRGVYYLPHSLVYHDHQRDSARKLSKKTWWHAKSAIRFFNKYGWKL